MVPAQRLVTGWDHGGWGSGEKSPSGWMLCAGQLSADHTCPRATTSPPIGPDGRRCVAWRESEEDNLQSDHKPLLWNIKCADSQRNLSYENHFTCSLMLTELNETPLLIKVSQSKLFWWFTSDLMNHVKQELFCFLTLNQKLKSGVSDTWMYYSWVFINTLILTKIHFCETGFANEPTKHRRSLPLWKH